MAQAGSWKQPKAEVNPSFIDLKILYTLSVLHSNFTSLCTSAAATVELQTINMLDFDNCLEQTRDRLSVQLLFGWK